MSSRVNPNRSCTRSWKPEVHQSTTPTTDTLNTKKHSRKAKAAKTIKKEFTRNRLKHTDIPAPSVPPIYRLAKNVAERKSVKPIKSQIVEDLTKHPLPIVKAYLHNIFRIETAYGESLDDEVFLSRLCLKTNLSLDIMKLHVKQYRLIQEGSVDPDQRPDITPDFPSCYSDNINVDIYDLPQSEVPQSEVPQSEVPQSEVSQSEAPSTLYSNIDVILKGEDNVTETDDAIELIDKYAARFKSMQSEYEQRISALKEDFRQQREELKEELKEIRDKNERLMKDKGDLMVDAVQGGQQLKAENERLYRELDKIRDKLDDEKEKRHKAEQLAMEYRIKLENHKPDVVAEDLKNMIFEKGKNALMNPNTTNDSLEIAKVVMNQLPDLMEEGASFVRAVNEKPEPEHHEVAKTQGKRRPPVQTPEGHPRVQPSRNQHPPERPPQRPKKEIIRDSDLNKEVYDPNDLNVLGKSFHKHHPEWPVPVIHKVSTFVLLSHSHEPPKTQGHKMADIMLLLNNLNTISVWTKRIIAKEYVNILKKVVEVDDLIQYLWDKESDAAKKLLDYEYVDILGMLAPLTEDKTFGPKIKYISNGKPVEVLEEILNQNRVYYRTMILKQPQEQETEVGPELTGVDGFSETTGV